jgi:putative ABC transport system permease protein
MKRFTAAEQFPAASLTDAREPESIQAVSEVEHRRVSGFELVMRNIRARPLRSSLNVVAIALQVFLVLLIVGLTSGVLADWGERAEGVGADILVQAPNSSIFFAFSSAIMQESLAGQIAALPGVRDVAPVVVIMDSGSLTIVYGIEEAKFEALSKGFQFVSGHRLEQPDDILADDLVAASKHIRAGDTVSLLNHEFHVAGIVVHGKGARYFINLKTAQEIASAENRVSMIYVRSTGDTNAVRAEIVQLLPNYVVRSMSEYMTLMTSSNLPELRPFIRAFVLLGATISFLVVLLTMHTMVMERTREIGILKALGSTRLDVLRLIEAEAGLMAGFGSVAGVVITFSLSAILKSLFPTLQIRIDTAWVFRAIALAIIASAIGALYPAYRAAKADPIEALAYE